MFARLALVLSCCSLGTTALIPLHASAQAGAAPSNARAPEGAAPSIARAPEGALRPLEALPLARTVQAGKPLHELKLNVEGAGPAAVVVAGKRHEIPIRGVRGAHVETIALAKDAALTAVRVEGEHESWLLLLGGRSGAVPLANTRVDWLGDPGERRMFALEVSEPDATGARSVRFGTRYEGLSQCTPTPPLLDAKKVDPASLEAAAAETAPALFATAPQETAVPRDTPSAAPALLALEAAGSSRIDEGTRFFLTPRALADGLPETSWALANGDFASMRWTRPQVPLRRLELLLDTTGALTATQLLVLGDDGRALRVALPAVAGTAGGARKLQLEVPLKEPWTTRCLSVRVEGLPKGSALAVAEVRAYTELDEPGSVERLVSTLVQDGEQGANAADLLAALGEPGAVAVAGRFEELSPRGKRRGLRVLSKGLAEPTVLARVKQAARADDSDLSGQALSVLQSGGEPGRVALRELALEPSSLGDAAALALVQRPGEIAPLLAAVSAEQGAERGELRKALTTAVRREPQTAPAAVDAWLAGNPSPGARASAALALANAKAPTLALRLAEPAWTSEHDFPTRYRFAHALAAADASPEADAWLEREGGQASEWMMRRAAFEALSARDRGRAQPLALSLASDAYPRVRAATLPVLAEQPSGLPRALELAQKDSWPLVRTAAARAFASRPEARAQLVIMVSNPSARVRAAAIDSLGALEARDAWPAVQARLLEANKETFDVHQAAIAFARQLCVQEAREALIQSVRRALRPEAGEEDARLGVEALHALHDLGGAAAADAKGLATRAEAPPGLAKAYTGFRPPACEKPAPAHAP